MITNCLNICVLNINNIDYYFNKYSISKGNSSIEIKDYRDLEYS